MSQRMSIRDLATPRSQSILSSLSVPSDLPLRLNATVYAVTTPSYNPLTSSPASGLLNSEDVMISIPDPQETTVAEVAELFVKTWNFVEGTLKGAKMDLSKFSQLIIRNSQNCIIPSIYTASDVLTDSEKLHVLAVLPEIDSSTLLTPITKEEFEELSMVFSQEIECRKRKRAYSGSPDNHYNESSYIPPASQLSQRIYGQSALPSDGAKRRKLGSQETIGLLDRVFNSGPTYTSTSQPPAQEVADSNDDSNIRVMDSEVEASVADEDDDRDVDFGGQVDARRYEEETDGEEVKIIVNGDIHGKPNGVVNGERSEDESESEEEDEPTSHVTPNGANDSDAESAPARLLDTEAIESSGEDSDNPLPRFKLPRCASSSEEDEEDGDDEDAGSLKDFIVDDDEGLEEEGSEDGEEESLDARERRDALRIKKGKKRRGLKRKMTSSSEDEQTQSPKKSKAIMVSESEDGDGDTVMRDRVVDEEEDETSNVPELVSRTLTASEEEETAVEKKVNGVRKNKGPALFDDSEEESSSVSPAGKAASPLKVETVSPPKKPAGTSPSKLDESSDEESDEEPSVLQGLARMAKNGKLAPDGKKPAGKSPAKEDPVESPVEGSPVEEKRIQESPVEPSPAKKSPSKQTPVEKSPAKSAVYQSPPNPHSSENEPSSVPQGQPPEPAATSQPPKAEKEKKKRKKKKKTKAAPKTEQLDHDSQDEKPLTGGSGPSNQAESKSESQAKSQPSASSASQKPKTNAPPPPIQIPTTILPTVVSSPTGTNRTEDQLPSPVSPPRPLPPATQKQKETQKPTLTTTGLKLNSPARLSTSSISSMKSTGRRSLLEMVAQARNKSQNKAGLGSQGGSQRSSLAKEDDDEEEEEDGEGSDEKEESDSSEEDDESGGLRLAGKKRKKSVSRLGKLADLARKKNRQHQVQQLRSFSQLPVQTVKPVGNGKGMKGKVVSASQPVGAKAAKAIMTAASLRAREEELRRKEESSDDSDE